ncbi:hypothetical protein C8J57DRAFT_1515086 [Mycena rebaudengoi]|nr:hypothetical protein C8J57DRAFT_1515086 [Mycena rebaudengoi]
MALEPPKEQDPPNPVVLAAQFEVYALFDRQSSTLKEAAARYSLKTDRPPPRGFDTWLTLRNKNRVSSTTTIRSIETLNHFINWPKTIPCGSSYYLTYSW